ncbi:MAG: hypothetical protein ACE5FC_07850 [Myxococcota bacterium]
MSASENAGESGGKPAAGGGDSFWGRHGDDVILALLFLYVILLGIGTVAELFDITSILRWPIYR